MQYRKDARRDAPDRPRPAWSLGFLSVLTFSDEVGLRKPQGALHRWIEAARTMIYIENQYILATETLALLARAAARGVDVIVVAPYRPDPNLVLYPKELMGETRAALAALAG